MVKCLVERKPASLFLAVLFLLSSLSLAVKIEIDASEEISENVELLSILREMVMMNQSSDLKGLVHIVKRAAVKAEDKNKGNMTVTAESESVTPLPFTRSNCRKYLMIMAKRLMKHFSGCMKQLKIDHPGKGEFDKFFNCGLRCAMEKASMLDGNGTLTAESFNVFVTNHIPERFYNIVHLVTGSCLQEHSAKIKGLSEDPQCLGLGDFMKCSQNFVGDNC